MYEGDWLGLRPRFFHRETGLPFLDFEKRALCLDEIDPAGLGLYLKFGYIAFGQTLSTNFRFDPPGLAVDASISNGATSLADPVASFSAHLQENDIMWEIRSRLTEKLRKSSNPIVLPLSGGHDSRILLWALRDLPRDQIRTFTYGTSFPQNQSLEVLLAKDVAHREGVKWDHIQIGGYNKYMPRWFEIMGATTHAHGMYHIDFYSQIRDALGLESATVVSGLVGDAWAGKINLSKIDSPDDLDKLNYSHGLRAPEWVTAPFSQHARAPMQSFFELKREILRDPNFRVVELIRLKSMLLRYLIKVPESLGFQVLTPFTDLDIALSMLRLPSKRRANRLWQLEFFERERLHSPKKITNARRNSSLDYQAMISGSSPDVDFSNLLGLLPISYVAKGSQPFRFSTLEAAFLLSELVHSS